MKKKIIISVTIAILFVLNSKSLLAQQTRRDTLNYLQQVVENKANYIGKPFSVLKKDIKLEIKSFSPFGAANRYEETSTTFYFKHPKKQEDFSYPQLIITWTSPLDMRMSDSLFFKNHRKWDSEIESFYAPAIIADIRTR